MRYGFDDRVTTGWGVGIMKRAEWTEIMRNMSLGVDYYSWNY
jgi:hypothetical protein